MSRVYLFIYLFIDKQQLLAVGDQLGTLHIVEVPWSFRQPIPHEVLYIVEINELISESMEIRLEVWRVFSSVK